MLKFPVDYITLLLSVFSMIAVTIVFIFTNFQTKVEAEHDREMMTRSMRDLREDVGEARREMNAKLDELLREKH